MNTNDQLNAFLETWEDTPRRVKSAFSRLWKYLSREDQLKVTFLARPGVSHSLRVAHLVQKARPLFLILDIIEDKQEGRWLSVCFYPDMITDPEERGNLIPLGLLGQDGYCFDMEEWDDDFLSYLEKRLDEAYSACSHDHMLTPN
jgi:hypothetical protein